MTVFSRSITNHLSSIDSYIQEANATSEQRSTCSETISQLAKSIHRFNLDDKLFLLEKLADLKYKEISEDAPRKRRRLNRRCTQVALNSLEQLHGKVSSLEKLIIDELWGNLWSAAIGGDKQEVLYILNKNLPSEIVQRIFYPFDHSRSLFALSQYNEWHDVSDKLFSLYPLHSHALINFDSTFFPWDQNIVLLAVQENKETFLSALFSNHASFTPSMLKSIFFTPKKHETILHCALRYGHTKTFLFLLSQVNAIALEPEKILLKTDLDDISIFDLPFVRDNGEVLEAIFSELKDNLSPYLLSRNENDENLLHIACRLGNPAFINAVFENIPRLSYENSVALFEPNCEGRSFLHLACLSNSPIAIKALFSQCKNLASHLQTKLFLLDQDDNSPLHLACTEANANLAKVILQETAKIQRLLPDNYFAFNSNDDTIFHLAISSESLPLAKIVFSLLKEARSPHLKKVFSPNKDGDTIAHLACRTNDAELMSLVFSIIQEYPASILKDIFAKNSMGKTFFHIVCSNGGLETLECTLAFFRDLPFYISNELWTRDTNNNTALHLACESASEEFVKKIQAMLKDLPDDSLIDCFAANNSGKTILHIACERGLEDFVTSLFSFIHDLDSQFTQDFWAVDRKKKTALHYACLQGSPGLAREIFKQLSRHPVDEIQQFLSPDDSGDTFLHYACRSGNLELAELAYTQVTPFPLKLKKFLYLANNNGKSILHLSVSQNNTKLSQFIIEKSSLLREREIKELFQADHLGQTPLHLACQQGNYEIAILIINASKRLSTHIIEELFSPDTCGNSILHTACHNSNLKLLHLIFSQLHNFPAHHIQKLFFPNPRGDTILHYVCKSNRTAAARFIFSQIQKLPGNLIVRMLQENAKKYSPLEFDYARVWTRSLFPKLTVKQLQRLLQSLSKQMRSSCLLMLQEEQVQRLPEEIQDEYKRIVNDRKVEINTDHFQREVDFRINNPNTPDVDISSLSTMFREINFSFPNQPGYKDPRTLKDDENQIISIPEVLEGLDLMIHRVKNRVPFLGTPNQTYPEELERFYQNIESSLKHITHTLQELPKEEKVQYLAQLGVAGNFCGGRYISETQYLFSLLSGFSSEHLEQLTIENKILSCLHDLRFTIFHELLSFLAKGSSVDAHNYALYMRSVGKEIGLQTASLTEFNDPFSSNQVHMELVMHRFHSRYTPTALIDEVSNFFNNIVMKKAESRDVLIDWFKENAPKKSDPVKYLMSVFEDSESWKLKRKYVVILLKRMKILRRSNIADLLFS